MALWGAVCAIRGGRYARLRRARGTERGRERGRAESRERRAESGGRGADRAADYREKMLRRGKDTDAFRFIEETFRNGMPPHGGFAIGLERITACFLGIANVKECSMFPRDINRVAP